MRGTEVQNPLATPERFSYPHAAQSEIVRAHQKDVYYRDQFYAQIKEVASDLLGSRRSHVYGELLSLIASVAYFGLSTLGGVQSLGEEYVNAMMRYRPTGRIIHAKRRAVFIILHIVAPFVLKKTYGVLRLYITRKDQQIAQRNQRELIHAQIAAAQEKPVEPVHHNWYTRMQRKYEATVQRLALVLPGSHVLEASNGLVAYISAAQLTVFYLFGRYYTLAHRLAKVDYLYASAHRPNSRPQSYEVLGVLLGTQLLVKLGMTVHAAYKKHKEITLQAPGNDTMTNAADPLSSGRPAMSVQLDETYVSHTDQASAPWGHKQPAGVPLDYPDASAPLSPEHLGFPRKLDASDRSRFEAAQAACRAKTTQLEAVADEVLRCTLCMDRRTPEMGNSAVTECGHVFCWDCITGWIKEKPECPLCRQAVQANKLIPIYNL